MDSEDENWESVWPPECTGDGVLVKACIEAIRDNPGLHAQAWNTISNCRGLGIHEDKTLLEELYTKSGAMVKPFFDEAIARLFQTFPFKTDEVETILLPIDDDDVAVELYRGCVWEVTAIVAACILSLVRPRGTAGERIPLSPYEPIERAHFILKQY